MFFVALLLAGCDDFIAQDISEEKILLHAPADQTVTEQTSVTFWWEDLPVSTPYRLQIVVPSFEEPISLVLDSLVTTHQHTLELNPGTYSWRVRAENGNYTSAYSPTRYFVVKSASPSPSVETDELENSVGDDD